MSTLLKIDDKKYTLGLDENKTVGWEDQVKKIYARLPHWSKNLDYRPGAADGNNNYTQTPFNSLEGIIYQLRLSIRELKEESKPRILVFYLINRPIPEEDGAGHVAIEVQKEEFILT